MPASALLGDGIRLDEVYAGLPGVEERLAELRPRLSGPLPDGGWLEIERTPRSGAAGPGERRRYAAPLQPDRSGWALLDLVDGRRGWIVSANPGPVGVLPSKAVRAAGLHLEWGSPDLVSMVDPHVVVRLRNGAGRPWSNDAQDNLIAICRLWMSGTLPGAGWFAYGGHVVRSLAPGEAIDLSCQFVDADLAQLRRGRARARVFVPSLGLRLDHDIVLDDVVLDDAGSERT